LRGERLAWTASRTRTERTRAIGASKRACPRGIGTSKWAWGCALDLRGHHHSLRRRRSRHPLRWLLGTHGAPSSRNGASHLRWKRTLRRSHIRMVRVRGARNGLVRDHVNWCGILRPTHRSISAVTSGRLGWRWRQLSTARDTATWRRIGQRQNSAGAESYSNVSRRYAPAARKEV